MCVCVGVCVDLYLSSNISLSDLCITKPSCLHGGYANSSHIPDSCTKCICPGGYGGDTCELAETGNTPKHTFMLPDSTTTIVLLEGM